MKFSQFVGMHEAKAWPFDQTNFTPVSDGGGAFSLKLNQDGLFESMTVANDAPIFVKNIMRGWATTLQVNSGKIAQGARGFKSDEVCISRSTFHGTFYNSSNTKQSIFIVF